MITRCKHQSLMLNEVFHANAAVVVEEPANTNIIIVSSWLNSEGLSALNVKLFHMQLWLDLLNQEFDWGGVFINILLHLSHFNNLLLSLVVLYEPGINSCRFIVFISSLITLFSRLRILGNRLILLLNSSLSLLSNLWLCSCHLLLILLLLWNLNDLFFFKCNSFLLATAHVAEQPSAKTKDNHNDCKNDGVLIIIENSDEEVADWTEDLVKPGSFRELDGVTDKRDSAIRLKIENCLISAQFFK